MNHATIIQKTDAQVATRLLRFLGADEAWLVETRMEAGLNWLNAHYGNTGQLRALLAGHKLFWAWWNNAWAGRDMALSNRTKVGKDGVMAIRVGEVNTDFVHDSGEFGRYYGAIHRVEKLTIQLDGAVLAAIIKSAKENR